MSLSRKLVLASALAFGAAPAVALADPAPVAQVVKPPPSAPVAQTDATSYANRESHDRQVESYQGGSTVMIGMSGGALLVMLFLLLLV